MTDAAESLVHIGEVAERTGLSHRTIRYYEEMGLVEPAARTEGGFRLYDEAGIERLLLIMPMKPLGFSIEQIGDLLRALDALADPHSSEHDRTAAHSLVAYTRGVAQERIAELKASTAKAEAFTRRLGRVHTSPASGPTPG
ncbi:MerR family transcriptional regulator [Serinicoccus sediminis]|uniref:MerR family transcriptional regulator n=1 Tax=Serinicoccus sediminis TaxID=2306021 RepID=UPI0010217B98|nr:MerR family transcriptional regulator [Serinicoccus sediminis]